MNWREVLDKIRALSPNSINLTRNDPTPNPLQTPLNRSGPMQTTFPIQIEDLPNLEDAKRFNSDFTQNEPRSDPVSPSLRRNSDQTATPTAPRPTPIESEFNNCNSTPSIDRFVFQFNTVRIRCFAFGSSSQRAYNKGFGFAGSSLFTFSNRLLLFVSNYPRTLI